jgi:hypothetical protein
MTDETQERFNKLTYDRCIGPCGMAKARQVVEAFERDGIITLPREQHRSTVMQGIVTKYFCPTNVRGSRVKAMAWAGNVTLEWEPSLGSHENHLAAVTELMRRRGWQGVPYAAGMPSGDAADRMWVIIDGR